MKEGAPILFSVVIPLYNRANYIQKAIQSVIDQSFSSFELIVVDDGSTDNSVEIVSAIKDPRIQIIELPQNLGNASARNEGWKTAQGEWVVYLDSDDWFENSYLENLSKEIQNNSDVTFFWTGVRFVGAAGQIFKEEIWSPKIELPSSTFFDELRIGTNCGVAFRRKLLMDHKGFDETFKASVDREFFLRISQNERGTGIKLILVNCLIGSHSSVRKNKADQAKSYETLSLMYSREINQSKSRRRWWYHKSMWLQFYSGNKWKGTKCFFKIPIQFKSIVLFLIFLLLPIKYAKSIHSKFGNYGVL